MSWLPYFILAYVTLGLQIGLSGLVDIAGARPNLVLLAVIFIAINAPRDAALLGSFALGVLQDLATEQTLGVYSFCYGLVAMFVVSTQQIVYRGHPLTHFSLALAGSLMTGIIMLIHGWIRGPSHPPMLLFYAAIYTSVLAPLILGALDRARRVFSFQPTRRKYRL